MSDLFQTPPAPPSDELLRDWLVGANAEAVMAVERWGAREPEHRDWLDRLRSAYHAGRPEEFVLDSAMAFDRVRQRMRADGTAHSTVTRPNDSATGLAGTFVRARTSSSRDRGPERGWMRRRITGASGVITTILTVALVIVGIGKVRTGAQRGVTKIYTTTATQSGAVSASDGTRITLASATTVRLENFGAQSRTVVVDRGEVFFQVAHAAGAPFTVRSGVFTTRVLGTAFLVRRYPGETRVRIAVMDGRVRVTSPSRMALGLTLDGGRVGELTDSTTRTTSVDDLPARTEVIAGQFVFRDAPLSTVLSTLTRWYGYQFRCTDSTLPNRNVTIGVSMRSSSAALAKLEQILSVNLNVVGDTVTLVPQVVRRTKAIPRAKSYDVWTPVKEVGR